METEQLIEKANKKYLVGLIIRLVIVILIIGTLIGYFLSPISSFNNYSLKGNTLMNIDELYEFLNINSNDSLYSISETELDNRLDEIEILNNYQFSLTPFGVSFYIEDRPICALYNNNILDENNKIVVVSDYKKTSTKNYLEDHEKRLGEFISDPRENSNLSNYLLIASYVNADNKYIYYLESLINDNNFAFYYNIYDNNYLRIILNYSSTIPLSTYQENLDYSQDELNPVYKAVSRKKEIKHNDQFGFDYYDVNLSLIDEKGTSQFEF